MVELFFWPTPNGMKVLMFLEEAGVDYQITSVNINEGEQFSNEFLQIAPNGRIPAIIDHAPIKSSEAISIFESGAILIYLAEKVGQFLPDSLVERTNVLQWLMWQMGGLGPMLGQNHHFSRYAPEEVPYAIRRYHQETSRLYAVLETVALPSVSLSVMSIPLPIWPAIRGFCVTSGIKPISINSPMLSDGLSRSANDPL